MPRNTSYCQNCAGNKENVFDNLCLSCQSAVDEARTKAAAEGTDLAEARLQALANRTWNTHTGRVNPRFPVTRGSAIDGVMREKFGE